MVLTAADSIVGVFSPAEGRGCLTQLKDYNGLCVPICTSLLVYCFVVQLLTVTPCISVLTYWFCQWGRGIRVKNRESEICVTCGFKI